MAVSSRAPDALLELLRIQRPHETSNDMLHRKILRIACEGGHTAAVRIVLSRASIDLRCVGPSALTAALAAGHTEIAHMLTSRQDMDGFDVSSILQWCASQYDIQHWLQAALGSCDASLSPSAWARTNDARQAVLQCSFATDPHAVAARLAPCPGAHCDEREERMHDRALLRVRQEYKKVYGTWRTPGMPCDGASRYIMRCAVLPSTGYHSLREALLGGGPPVKRPVRRVEPRGTMDTSGWRANWSLVLPVWRSTLRSMVWRGVRVPVPPTGCVGSVGGVAPLVDEPHSGGQGSQHSPPAVLHKYNTCEISRVGRRVIVLHRAAQALSEQWAQ